MSIYDLLIIVTIVAGSIGFVLGVITTIRVNNTHERVKEE